MVGILVAVVVVTLGVVAATGLTGSLLAQTLVQFTKIVKFRHTLGTYKVEVD